jgi:hypothetical protein
MISIKKIGKKLLFTLILFLIWYGLRWYFVIPREEYLGSFDNNGLYSIKIYERVNYDDVVYYYDYSIQKDNIEVSEKRKFLCADYGELAFSDFNFQKMKDKCYITIKYQTIDKIDTLLVVDNKGKVISPAGTSVKLKVASASL